MTEPASRPSRYSAWSLLRAAMNGHASWGEAWRDAEPKKRYEIVVVGGGGHGLATAYYLAANHGITDVAVVEAGWIGGGNTGRNTTVARSNYLFPESARLYEFSLRLYESLTRELNFNLMFSQRGMVILAHSRHDLDNLSKWANAMRFNGVDAEVIGVREVLELEPRLNMGQYPEALPRFPILGGLVQRRAGTLRHDAVAWGYARAASARGIDIIQNCAVTGFIQDGSRVVGVRTVRGEIRAGQVALAVAGHSSRLAAMAGLKLPIVSHALQAMVSEPVKPVLNTVTLSPAVGAYWSQSDKGEVVIGGGLDPFPSYAQRGSFAITQQVLAATLAMFPTFSRLRLLRQWAGIVDIVHDSSPLIGATPVPGLLINAGWGTGGFKAIPVGGWTLAHRLATGRDHDLAVPFSLDRFRTGRFIDEAAAAGIAH